MPNSLDIHIHTDRNGTPRLSVSVGRGKSLPVEVSHAFVELVRLEGGEAMKKSANGFARLSAQLIARESAEREALAILRRLGKRRSFKALFSSVVDIAHQHASMGNAEEIVWSDLEELLSIDLDPKVTP